MVRKGRPGRSAVCVQCAACSKACSKARSDHRLVDGSPAAFLVRGLATTARGAGPAAPVAAAAAGVGVVVAVSWVFPIGIGSDMAGSLGRDCVLYGLLYALLWCAQPYMPYTHSQSQSHQRLRHFADWSDNSSEYHILREVENNFVSTFLEATATGREDSLGLGGPAGAAGAAGVDDNVVVCPSGERERVCSLDQWLSRWGTILDQAKTFHELPVWLQYFPRVMFQVINKSGSGVVSRDELSAFYSSVLGLGAERVGEVLDGAYKAMTANGDHPLCFPAYRWCYANFLLGRHRNGPGQYLFGPGEPAALRSCPFPVDYSALNTAPEELEQYSPDRKSNRRSVVV